MVHGELVRQIQYLKAENQVLRSKLGRCINLKACEKRRLVKFGLPLGGSIKDFMSIVSYTTFRKWVNEGVNNNKHKSKIGRPRKNSKEIRELVVKLARENNWGYTRILGELKKLNIKSLSRSTIRRILKEHGLDPAPKRSEDTWDDFIKRHFKTLWACDFFTKTVWTMLGPKTFHILFFINVLTRKVHIAGITKNPTREWVNSKAKTVSFIFKTDKKSKLLIRDGDGKYSKEFDEIFKKLNIHVKKIPYKSPNLNPYAEGFVGTIKRECLDYFFVFGERHLRYLVKEYLKYYNSVRPHGSLDNMPLGYKSGKDKGRIKCESRLGGIIKHYYRN
ncbi:MAG: integrase core domain-containing protein [Planctomycetota bacterium]|jgi:putative transposase